MTQSVFSEKSLPAAGRETINSWSVVVHISLGFDALILSCGSLVMIQSSFGYEKNIENIWLKLVGSWLLIPLGQPKGQCCSFCLLNSWVASALRPTYVLGGQRNLRWTSQRSCGAATCCYKLFHMGNMMMKSLAFLFVFLAPNILKQINIKGFC